MTIYDDLDRVKQEIREFLLRGELGEIRQRVVRLNGQIIRTSLYAKLAMARVLSGVSEAREVTDLAGRRITPLELKQQDLATARAHIERIEELTEMLCLYEEAWIEATQPRAAS